MIERMISVMNNMTREEAMNFLKSCYPQNPTFTWSVLHKEALEQAISDMEKIKKIEQIFNEFDGSGSDYFEYLKRIFKVIDNEK